MQSSHPASSVPHGLRRMADARRVLLRHFGHAEFRPAQLRVLESVFAGRDTLAVLPTGGGKSICFQVPAVVFGGLTLVVSPLISLMQDQVAAARGRGIPAACLTSGLAPRSSPPSGMACATGRLRLLYVSPERLDGLVPRAPQRAASGPSCSPSTRPTASANGDTTSGPATACCAPRATGWAIRRPSRSPAVPRQRSATTSSARSASRRPPCCAHRLVRPAQSLVRRRSRSRTSATRFDALLRLLGGDDRLAIVYAPTRGVTESLARALFTAGYRAAPYHAGLTRQRPRRDARRFLARPGRSDRRDLRVRHGHRQA